jgi:hypothetical protein
MATVFSIGPWSKRACRDSNRPLVQLLAFFVLGMHASLDGSSKSALPEGIAGN